MSPRDDDLDLTAVRRELEARRDATRERLAVLAKRPELGSAQGFGKRIGDGTTEAISRLTEIGVGRSLEGGLDRTERALAKLEEGSYGRCDACGEPIAPHDSARCPTASCACPVRPRCGARHLPAGAETGGGSVPASSRATFFADHAGRHVRVPRPHLRHDRGVGHDHVLEAMHGRIGADDREG